MVNINKTLYHMKCADFTALGISNQHFCKRNCMANMILFLSCFFFFILVKHQYSSGPDSMASKIQINKATRIGAVKPNTMQIGLKFHSITVYLHENIWTKKDYITKLQKILWLQEENENHLQASKQIRPETTKLK